MPRGGNRGSPVSLEVVQIERQIASSTDAKSVKRSQVRFRLNIVALGLELHR